MQSFRTVALLLLGLKVIVGEGEGDCIDFNSYISHH